MIWELSKAGFIVVLSVMITLIALKFKPAPRWVEIDVAKLIQQQAYQLGKQNLPEVVVQKHVANFMPRIRTAVEKVSQQHKVMVVLKGTSLSPLPDFTDRISGILEQDK